MEAGHGGRFWMPKRKEWNANKQQIMLEEKKEAQTHKEIYALKQDLNAKEATQKGRQESQIASPLARFHFRWLFTWKWNWNLLERKHVQSNEKRWSGEVCEKETKFLHIRGFKQPSAERKVNFTGRLFVNRINGIALCPKRQVLRRH